MGTPNTEPQECSRIIIGIYLPGSLYSIIFLLRSWGSLFGVPIKVPVYPVDHSRALFPMFEGIKSHDQLGQGLDVRATVEDLFPVALFKVPTEMKAGLFKNVGVS